MTTTLAAPIGVDELAPQVPFSVFVSRLFHWKQGQHTAFIGPTGSGKTTLAMRLLQLQPYVAVMATKPRDDTLDKWAVANNYHVFKKWPGLLDNDIKKYPRRVIWPKLTILEERQVKKQKEVIHDALGYTYGEGGWCVYVDELWYLSNILNLAFDAKVMLLQARSLNISFAISSQRPAFIPLEVYDQSTHMFFWRDNDERNLSRLSGISWRSAMLVRELIANLERYEFLYVHNESGAMLRSKVERIPG